MVVWVLSSFMVVLWLFWKASGRVTCKGYKPSLCTSGNTMEPNSHHSEHLQQEEVAGPSTSEECLGEAGISSSAQAQHGDVVHSSTELEPKQLKFGPSKGSLSKPRDSKIKKPLLSRFILGSSEDNSSDDEFASGSFKSVRKSSLTSSSSQTPSLSSLPETEPLIKIR